MNTRLIIFFALTIFIHSVFSHSLNAQNRTDSLDNIKQLIKKDNTISTPGIGLHQSPSSHWHAFVYMLHLASVEELEQMTGDTSAALRIFAYAGLVHHKSSTLKNIKKRLYSDKASVLTFFGCISDKPIDVANGTKQFIKICDSNEMSINELLAILKNDEKYKGQLYDDLVNDRRIERRPVKAE